MSEDLPWLVSKAPRPGGLLRIPLPPMACLWLINGADPKLLTKWGDPPSGGWFFVDPM